MLFSLLRLLPSGPRPSGRTRVPLPSETRQGGRNSSARQGGFPPAGERYTGGRSPATGRFPRRDLSGESGARSWRRAPSRPSPRTLPPSRSLPPSIGFGHDTGQALGRRPFVPLSRKGVAYLYEPRTGPAGHALVFRSLLRLL